MTKAVLSWSSGKDSAWALHLMQACNIEVAALITTLNAAAGCVAMHAVRRELVEAQASSIGIPLWTVPLPWPCSNIQYQDALSEVCARAEKLGVDTIVFGDLFLEDIRRYREQILQGTGLTPVFPLWKMPTESLARAMIEGGLRARIVCVDARVLPREFVGREYDFAFLADLPPSVDPCGENGEFHSFVYDGPMFREPIPFSGSEVRHSEGFVFSDMVL